MASSICRRMSTWVWGSILILEHQHPTPPIDFQPRAVKTTRRQDAKKSERPGSGFSHRTKRVPWCLGVLALAFGFLASAVPAFAEGSELIFLPNSLTYKPMLGDPREPHDSITLNSGSNPYEGAIGSFIELLQWK